MLRLSPQAIAAVSLIVAAVLLDWLSKSWALITLGEDFFPIGVLGLLLVRNDAFAFSSGAGLVVAEAVISARLAVIALVVVLGLRYSRSLRDVFGFSLMFAGAVGNMLDILFRDGAVVDFITTTPSTFLLAGKQLDLVFVFNLADIYVIVGVTLVWPLLRSLVEGVQYRPRKT